MSKEAILQVIRTTPPAYLFGLYIDPILNENLAKKFGLTQEEAKEVANALFEKLCPRVKVT